jgi:hypothetical protein
VLNTSEDHVCLDNIFQPAVRRTIFFTYISWPASDRGDIPVPIKDFSSELPDMTLEMELEWLLKMDEALKDEAFCRQVAKQQAEMAGHETGLLQTD